MIRYRIAVATLALLAAVAPLAMFTFAKPAAATTYTQTASWPDDTRFCNKAYTQYRAYIKYTDCNLHVTRVITVNAAVPKCRWLNIYIKGALGLWQLNGEYEWCFNGTNWAALDWSHCYIHHAIGMSPKFTWCGAWNNGDPRQLGRIEAGFNYDVSMLYNGSPLTKSGWVRVWLGDNGSWCCLQGK